MSLPVKIGAGFAGIAIVLVAIGIAKGTVPRDPASVALALAISAVTWGVVAWAVATAAVDTEGLVEEEPGNER
jgi:hypothetical protein